MSFGVGFRSGNWTVRHYAAEETYTDGTVQPEHRHEQEVIWAEAAIKLGVRITPRWSAGASIAYRLLKTRRRYLEVGSDTDFIPLYPDLHHRNETRKAFLDAPVLIGFKVMETKPFAVDIKAGVTIPTGQMEKANPYEEGLMKIQHNHFVFGNGTFDPLFQLTVRGSLGAWGYRLWGNTRQVVYEKKLASATFEGSDIYDAGLLIMPPLGLGQFTLGLGGKFFAQRPFKWDGIVYDESVFSRKTEVWGMAVLSSKNPSFAFDLGFDVALYRDVVAGSDVVYWPSVSINLDRSFF